MKNIDDIKLENNQKEFIEITKFFRENLNKYFDIVKFKTEEFIKTRLGEG